MVNNSEQKGKKNLVLMGVGFSGLELIRHWRLNPDLGSVTIIAESASDFFVFDALCSLKGVRNFFAFEVPSNTVCWKFLVAKVERVDVDHRRIFFQDGSIGFDLLVLVNECRPKFLTHKKGDAFPRSNGRVVNEQKTFKYVKEAVISGNGFVALALVDHLLEQGVKPTVVTKDHSLASSRFPEEEACLLTKRLRSKGVKLYFDQAINRYEVGEDGKIRGVQVTDGSKLVCQLVIHENGSFGAFSHCFDQSHAADKTLLWNQIGVKGSAKQVYLLGRNLYTGDAIAPDFPNLSLSDQGFQLARNIIGTKTLPLGSGIFSEYYRVAGLEWNTYGDLSTFCGKSSQNFYWEHPNGEVSFRLVFDKHNFSIKALGTLGIHFDSEFVARSFQQKQQAPDFINGLWAGVFVAEKNRELLPLIGRAFSVEFEGLKDKNKPSFLTRILEKFL